MVPGQRLRDQRHTYGRRHAENQTVGSRSRIVKAAAQHLLIMLYRQRHAPQQLSFPGQGEALVGIGEQRRLILLLQPADMLGDGRLGDVQRFGSPGIVHILAHSQKSIHSKIQHGYPSCFYHNIDLYINKDKQFFIMEKVCYDKATSEKESTKGETTCYENEREPGTDAVAAV